MLEEKIYFLEVILIGSNINNFVFYECRVLREDELKISFWMISFFYFYSLSYFEILSRIVK